MPHKIENSSGFTILELLVSIVIFVVILMAMAGFSTLLIKTNVANEVRNAAVRVGLSKLHQVTLLSFDSNLADSSGFLQVRDGTVAYTATFSSSSPAH
ncbi:MAG: prepilin-type N-terminal cleavage/methylation domain-containing protein [Epsilonproteobacteria bacterium]|nr:prepilin-type N-terminal cleavage/methylation domain-containing protein [Campylobacterota bacterium]